MTTPVVGEIRLFAGRYVPNGWLPCDGRLLEVDGNEVLFSLIGTTYGGNGQSTFALPDLRSRVPVGVGAGPGLTPRILGQAGGTETVTLTVGELPPHSHPMLAVGLAADTNSPAEQLLGSTGYSAYAEGGGDIVPLSANTTSDGGNQPHENRMPTLAMIYIIAAIGMYPDFS